MSEQCSIAGCDRGALKLCLERARVDWERLVEKIVDLFPDRSTLESMKYTGFR